MRVIEQQTEPVVMFLLVQSSDHVSPLTGLDSSVTVTISKNGSSFNAATNAVSEVGNGWYKITLSTSETYLAGVTGWDLVVHATGTGADPTDRMFTVEVATISNVDNEVDAISTAVSTNLDATISSRLASADSRLNNLDTTISSRLAASGYTAPPSVGAIDDQLTSTHGAGVWGGGSGSGSIAVNHNTGGTDNLRYVTSGGVGVDNANITAYLASDFYAGNIIQEYVKGNSTTNVEGRWVSPIMLDANDYVITFCKQGDFNTTWKMVTVS